MGGLVLDVAVESKALLGFVRGITGRHAGGGQRRPAAGVVDGLRKDAKAPYGVVENSRVVKSVCGTGCATYVGGGSRLPGRRCVDAIEAKKCSK